MVVHIWWCWYICKGEEVRVDEDKLGEEKKAKGGHISTKFYGIWICTLGDMHFSLKSTESARKVTNVGLL